MQFDNPIHQLATATRRWIRQDQAPIYTAKSPIGSAKHDDIERIDFYPNGHVQILQVKTISIPSGRAFTPPASKQIPIYTHIMIPIGPKHRYPLMLWFINDLYGDLVRREYESELAEANPSTTFDLAKAWPKDIDPLAIRTEVRDSRRSGRTLGLTTISERPPSSTDLSSRHGREFDPVNVLGMTAGMIAGKICQFRDCGGRLFKQSMEQGQIHSVPGNSSNHSGLVYTEAALGRPGKLQAFVQNSFVREFCTAQSAGMPQTVIAITGDNSHQRLKIPAESLAMEMAILLGLNPGIIGRDTMSVASHNVATIRIPGGLEQAIKLSHECGLLSPQDHGRLNSLILPIKLSNFNGVTIKSGKIGAPPIIAQPALVRPCK